MVVFPPACPPTVLHAYSTVPLPASVQCTVQHDFDIGAFARFHRPLTVLSIHDRSDFYSLSHFEIRQRLDREGHENGFILIDQHTELSHAVWWITTTSDSIDWTKDVTEEGLEPPIIYPGEAFPLWQLHVLTQDMPLQWVNWDIGNTDVVEDLQQVSQISPYDPHDAQNPPYTLGLDFSKKKDSDGFYPGPYVVAGPDEYDWSDGPELIKEWSPKVDGVVRLTEEAARDAGLISSWWPWLSLRPGPKQAIMLQQGYDWDSPKWAWDGKSLGNTTGSARPASYGAGIFKNCQRAERVNISQRLWGLHRGSRAQAAP